MGVARGEQFFARDKRFFEKLNRLLPGDGEGGGGGGGGGTYPCTTKADVASHDGTNPARLPKTGADYAALMMGDTSTTTGLVWAPIVSAKGSLFTHNGSIYVPRTVGPDHWALVGDSTDATGLSWANILGISDWIWGDGSDGALHFDGSNAVAGYSRSGSVYTAARNIYATSILTDAGVTVHTASSGGKSYGIFNQGLLTNNGLMGAMGNSASGSVAGLAMDAGYYGGSYNGAAGAAVNGLQAVAASFSMSTAGPSGGHGTSTNFGGAAPTVTPPPDSMGGAPASRFLINAIWGTGRASTILNAYTGGPGGSSAGGGGVGNLSGAGGGGGGVVGIFSLYIDGNGTFSVKGGNGGDAPGTNAGGGNGGSGGLIWICTSSAGFDSVATVDISGGALGHVNGGSNATDGFAGGVGKYHKIIVLP